MLRLSGHALIPSQELGESHEQGQRSTCNSTLPKVHLFLMSPFSLDDWLRYQHVWLRGDEREAERLQRADLGMAHSQGQQRQREMQASGSAATLIGRNERPPKPSSLFSQSSTAPRQRPTFRSRAHKHPSWGLPGTIPTPPARTSLKSTRDATTTWCPGQVFARKP